MVAQTSKSAVTQVSKPALLPVLDRDTIIRRQVETIAPPKAQRGHEFRFGSLTFPLLPLRNRSDVSLEEMKPVPDKPTHSYLNPELNSLDAKMSHDMPLYATSEKSPWRILEQGMESNSESNFTSGILVGKPGSSSSSAKKLKFVVGDSKGPVCFLIFDESGKLTELKPLP